MTFRGVAAGREVADGTLVVDVGGGSTELVLGGPDGVSWQASLDIGCVRLTERFLAGDPPSAGELAACRGAVRALLAERVPEDVRPSAAIGVAGTVTTLATLHLGLPEEDPERLHGRRVPVAWVEEELARLASATVEELRARPGIHPDRAPVMAAGAVVAADVLGHFGLAELEVSEQDILHAGALAAAELPAPDEDGVPPGAYTCC